MRLVEQLKIAKVVREQAREIAEIVGAARTLSGRYVNDVLEVVRDRARAWVREAYLTGYSDGLLDAIHALGASARSPKELNAIMQKAAEARVAGERRTAEAEQRRLADENEARKAALRQPAEPKETST